jgi:hypothetical protein
LTRQAVIESLGYEVFAPTDERDFLKVIRDEKIDLLVLGSSLESPTVHRLVFAFRFLRPTGRIVEIISHQGVEASRNADEVVVGLDGPPALQRAVERLLGKKPPPR